MLLLGAGDGPPDEQPLEATDIRRPCAHDPASPDRASSVKACATWSGPTLGRSPVRPEELGACRRRRMRPGGLVARPRPEEDGHTVAVIDRRAERVPPARRRLRRPHVVGRLRPGPPDRGRHGGGRALAAVTNGDNSNILVARVARETFGIERVVARIYDPRRAAIYERLGIPTVATVAVGDRAGAAPDPSRRAGGRVGRPQRQGLPGRAQPRRRLGRPPAARAENEPACAARRAHPARHARCSPTPTSSARRATSSDLAVAGDADRHSTPPRAGPAAREGH